MLKYIFPIAFVGLLVSCNSEEKPTPDVKAEVESEVVEKKSNKVYDPSSVTSRTEEFFDWYLDNSRMLYRMRSSCIGAENGFHALDEKKLKEYVAWLEKTDFFTENFIKTEHDRWTTECAEQMREKARKKERFVGPPPCTLQGDVFLKIKELPTKEMIDALTFTVSDQTETSAIVNYKERISLKWSSNDGSWKIDSWPN